METHVRIITSPKRKRGFRSWLTIAALLPILPACTGPAEYDDLIANSLLGSLQADTEPLPDDGDCLQLDSPSRLTTRRMFQALNEYRVDAGRSELAYSRRLEAAADAHLRDMYERGYFAHITPEGLTPGDRAMEAGFCHHYVGENLAAGQDSVRLVMQAWDQSPPHQVNMLEPDYAYVGMGSFVDPTGRHYWAQLFAFDVP